MFLVLVFVVVVVEVVFQLVLLVFFLFLLVVLLLFRFVQLLDQRRVLRNYFVISMLMMVLDGLVLVILEMSLSFF